MKTNRYLAHGKRLVLLLAMATCAAAQAAGVAFITNIKGSATADSAKLGLMAELSRGQRVACAAECTVGIMYLQSGREYVITGPGEYLVGEKEVSAKIGVPPAVRDTPWRVSAQTVQQAAQTSSASVRMRGVGGKPDGKAAGERLVYPLQTRVIDMHPAFRWHPVDGSGPYAFELWGAERGKVLYKARVEATELKLPAAVKLQPGGEYQWNVARAGTVLGMGSFKTPSAAALDRAQKSRPDGKAQFTDWVLYALTLNEIGATQDAQEVWSKLAAERPDLPELAALVK